MSYPGDQQQSDGWSPQQPSESTYGNTPRSDRASQRDGESRPADQPGSPFAPGGAPEHNGSYGPSEHDSAFGSADRDGGYGAADRDSGYGAAEPDGGFGAAERNGAYGAAERNGAYGAGGHDEAFGSGGHDGGFGASDHGGFGSAGQNGAFGAGEPFGPPGGPEPFSPGAGGEPYRAGAAGEPYGSGAAGEPYGSGAAGEPYGTGGRNGSYAPGSGYGPGEPYAPGEPGVGPERYSPNEAPFAPQGGRGPYGPESDPGRGFESAPGGYGSDSGPYSPGGYSGEPRGKSRKPLIIGAAAVGVLVLAGGGVAYAMTSGGSKAKPKQTAAPPGKVAPPANSPAPTPSSSSLNSRQTDPTPLTLNEVFKNKSFKVDGVKYTMVAKQADKKCANTVHGTKLKKALGTAGCDQLLRAAFETSNGKLVGTIGVANLTDSNAAGNVQTASRAKDAYVLMLPAGKVNGLGLASGTAQGHYVIFSWVQTAAATKNPKTADAVAFVKNTMVGSNLEAALKYRDMTGKPFGK